LRPTFIPSPPVGLPLPRPATAHRSPLDGLDLRWFLDINAFARDTGRLHPIMTGCADYRVIAFAVLLLDGWWLARRDGGAKAMAKALWAPLATAAALVINQPVVRYVAEPRPYSALSHVLVLTHRVNDFSFPSDHAAMAGAAAAGVWLIDRRLGLIATSAAPVMAFACVYRGAHYPEDVVADLVLGMTITLAGYALRDPAFARAITRLRLTPPRPLLATPSPRTSSRPGQPNPYDSEIK
jgi:undecaprenyl-diphosphatase